MNPRPERLLRRDYMLSPSLILVPSLSSDKSGRNQPASISLPSSGRRKKGKPANQHPSSSCRQGERGCDCYLCSQSNCLVGAYLFARCFSSPIFSGEDSGLLAWRRGLLATSACPYLRNLFLSNPLAPFSKNTLFILYHFYLLDFSMREISLSTSRFFILSLFSYFRAPRARASSTFIHPCFI